MAVSKLWPVTVRLATVLDYASNSEKTTKSKSKYSDADYQALRDVVAYAKDGEKTERELFCEGIHCNPQTAREQFITVKEQFDKPDGIQAYHGYLSFEETDITPELAQQVGMAFAERMWGDRFQVLVTTHLNTEHLHCHFVVNSVSFRDGKRLQNKEKAWWYFRHIADEVCLEHGLSVVQNPEAYQSPRILTQKDKAGMPTRYNLARTALDEAIAMSHNLRQLEYHLMSDPFHIVLCEDSVKTVLVLLLCYGMGIGIYFSTRRNYRRREEHGSAKWGNAKAVDKKYRQNPPSENKLMTQAVRIGLNGKKHRRNLNTLVCGGSGAGKTRFYCKPNLMQANTSFVILDPKGEIVRDVGNLLEEKGYEIRVLDLISMEKSHCYNPFVYLHSDNDVQRLVTNLFKSTTPKGSQSNDPFWDTSASMLLSALVYYLHYEAPEDEQNFAMVMEMLQAAAIDNEEDPRPSPLDCLFADLELDRPDHIALKYYRSYHTGSAKTLKSIQITLAARLEKFNLESLAALTCTDELDLASMGEKKVALFAIIPDNDSSFNFLVSILYTQLFQQLFFSADHIHGGALPIPVHFLMDEFANVSLPDDFDKILSVMRSRGVFVSIILQNLAQLKALFEKQWESIVGNCDEFLYLGGNEQSTHKYVSELLGKETIDTNTYGKSSGRSGNYSTNYQISGRELLTPDEVRMLDNRYAILFIRGELPVMDLKYDILKHPAVDLTADGKGGVYQHGKVTSNVATIEVQYLDPDTLPDTEVSETTYELLSDEDFNSETTNNTTTKLRR